MSDMELKALKIAERIGVTVYTVNGNTMTYYTNYPLEHRTIRVSINLYTSIETRKPFKNYLKKGNAHYCL